MGRKQADIESVEEMVGKFYRELIGRLLCWVLLTSARQNRRSVPVDRNGPGRKQVKDHSEITFRYPKYVRIGSVNQP